MALPHSAVLEATLEDVSRADAAADIVATTRFASQGNPPIAFTLTYDPARIAASHRYVVRARILIDAWKITEATLLECILLNLALNARDARDRGGELTIETERIAGAPPDWVPGADVPFARLTVCDTGCGMTPDVQFSNRSSRPGNEAPASGWTRWRSPSGSSSARCR